MKDRFQSERNDALERRIAAALDAAPPVVVPAGFAARTAALAAARYPAPAEAAPQTRFGTLASRLTLAALLLAMLLYAALLPKPSAMLTGSEILLALEFVALTTWLSLRPLGKR